MKTLFVTLCLFGSHITPYFAQAPDTMWTKVYGGNNREYGYDIQQTIDGGYIIVGKTNSFGAGAFDLWLIKTDSYGDINWTKTYGGNSDDEGRSVQRTSDGGYIIIGNIKPVSINDEDIWLLKTNELGDTLWTKIFGDYSWDKGYSVQQTSDGGYIVVGFTKSFGAGSKDIWLIKTDSSGDTLWTKTFGTAWDDEGYDVYQTKDDGYIITGYSSAGPSDYIWLLKTDQDGDTLWTRNYGGTHGGKGLSVLQTIDDGIVLTGYYYYSSQYYFHADVHLIKTNIIGELIWDKKLWHSGIGNSVQETSDQGFIVVAQSTFDETGNTGNLYLIKTNSLGDTIWTRKYLSNQSGIGYSVKQTTDEGYVFTGFIQADIFNSDVAIIKTNPDSGIVSVKDYININYSRFYLVQNYPNPFNPSTSVQYAISSRQFVSLKVYDVLGNEIARLVSEEKPAGNYEVEFNGERLTSGIYFYQLRAGEFIETKKMVLLR